MRQWLNVWKSFSTAQRLAMLAVALGVAAGLYGFAHWRKEGDFRPLYSELEPDDAGAIVARLQENGVDYRLSEDGRSVLVPSARVAEMRLSMATEGLPRRGRIGFELFDKNNFGATEFTEQVNYARALEGELERSIMQLSEVEQARIHVTFPKDSVFIESRQPAKGSVLLKLRRGARLNGQNVAAICHLVASAVEGLAPESVSVLDMDGNLLNRPRRTAPEGADAPDAMIEYRQSLERELVAKIQATLEPLVGPEKFRAAAAVECDFTSGEQSEETFDPTRSVMVSSQKTEDTGGTASAAGVPGTASNLPRPTSRPGSAGSSVSRRTENITYQSSRVVRRVRLPQGSIRRVSVSVLLDHAVRREGAGPKARRIVEPLPPERIKAIQELVAAAIGLQPLRGDQLVVESLPFDATLNSATPDSPLSAPPPPAGGAPQWLRPLLGDQKLPIGAAVAGTLALLLAVALRFAVRKRRSGAVELQAPRELPAGAAAPSPRVEAPAKEAGAALPELPEATLKRSDIVAERVREMVSKNPAGSAQVLRSWLAEEEH